MTAEMFLILLVVAAIIVVARFFGRREDNLHELPRLVNELIDDDMVMFNRLSIRAHHGYFHPYRGGDSPLSDKDYQLAMDEYKNGVRYTTCIECSVVTTYKNKLKNITWLYDTEAGCIVPRSLRIDKSSQWPSQNHVFEKEINKTILEHIVMWKLTEME